MPTFPTLYKEDVLSGFLVFLIALPLCMGISMASNVPPVAGIITAIIGGIVCSFLGSSRLTIKGPAAGLIVIALACVQELGAGDASLGYKRLLAVGVIAAVIQISFALLCLGAVGEMMPPSVVHGMLAAIGVTIISKQIHLLFGVTPLAKTPFALLAEIPQSIQHLNPEVFLIGGIALALLVIIPLLKMPLLKKLPTPLLVICFAIPVAIYFDFEHPHHFKLLGEIYSIGPNYLVTLPSSLLSALTFPDFSDIQSFASIKYIIMFSLVGSIESLLTVSAVDSLDKENRSSDLNKDLFALGVGNLLASCVGGLPMISEIVRSKANIDNGARSSWANAVHGVFLLIFVSFFPNILHLIPLTVLSAMLIYTGFRLASPREFKHTYHMGKDQLIIFLTTFLVTLGSDLLSGVAVGVALKIVLHILRGASPRQLFATPLRVTKNGKRNIVEIEGASIFTNYLSLKRVIEAHFENSKEPIEINFQRTSIIDLTVQTKLKYLRKQFGAERILVVGLDQHRAQSKFEQSTKVLSRVLET
jgi:MFS superfamily sulfate permease-like transporter